MKIRIKRKVTLQDVEQMHLKYPNQEIVIVLANTKDQSPEELDKISRKYPNVKFSNSIGNREVSNPRTFNLTVHIRNKVYNVSALENETLLTAMERAGIKAPSSCKSGSCGFCHSRLIKGNYYVNKEHEYRRAADLKFGYIHPCCTYPESDMEIDVPPFNVGGNK